VYAPACSFGYAHVLCNEAQSPQSIQSAAPLEPDFVSPMLARIVDGHGRTVVVGTAALRRLAPGVRSSPKSLMEGAPLRLSLLRDIVSRSGGG
jgi:hypothetical protein